MSSELPIPDYLAKLNAHERDPFIQFDPVPHVYTVRGEGGYTSVTTFVHSHFEHFDADAQAQKIVNGKNMSNPNYKYYGMTVDQIKQLWNKNGEEASSAGTKLHYDIECYWNGWKVENESIEYGYFQKFVADFQAKNPGVTPYRTEWMVYYEELKYTYISQKPKIEFVGLISNIGGSLGLFVGISFVSFLELFELFSESLFIYFE